MESSFCKLFVLCSVFVVFFNCALMRFHQVKNAMIAGAKGIVLFSDPADYCAPGVHVCVFVCFCCAFDPLFVLNSVGLNLRLTCEN